MNKFLSKCLIIIIIMIAFLSCSDTSSSSTNPIVPQDITKGDGTKDDGKKGSGTAEYTLTASFVNTSATQNAKLTVTWDGLPSPKEVASALDLIQVPKNKTVTFTLEGTEAKTIILWSQDIKADTGTTQTLTMDSDKTVIVTIAGGF